MTKMYKYTKEVNVTYFEKQKKITIDEVTEGEVIYLKVHSPLNYGIRECSYYGKLIKKTNLFFDILEYNTGLDNLNTEQIRNYEKNQKKYTKRWAKKSIIEIYLVKTKEKKELREYETNCIDSIKARK